MQRTAPFPSAGAFALPILIIAGASATLETRVTHTLSILAQGVSERDSVSSYMWNIIQTQMCRLAGDQGMFKVHRLVSILSYE
jgi:hypothetical protein